MGSYSLMLWGPCLLGLHWYHGHLATPKSHLVEVQANIRYSLHARISAELVDEISSKTNFNSYGTIVQQSGFPF